MSEDAHVTLQIIAPRIIGLLFNRHDITTLMRFARTSKRIYLDLARTEYFAEHMRILKLVYEAAHQSLTIHPFLSKNRWRHLAWRDPLSHAFMFWYKDFEIELHSNTNVHYVHLRSMEVRLNIRIRNNKELNSKDFHNIAALIAPISKLLPRKQRAVLRESECNLPTKVFLMHHDASCTFSQTEIELHASKNSDGCAIMPKYMLMFHPMAPYRLRELYHSREIEGLSNEGQTNQVQ